MMRPNQVWAFLAVLWLGTASTWAFPSWIGVYGAHQRHNGSNPGTFSILMNQDYFGLNAEVGIQVNGGAWTIYPMAYAGNVDGNSKWTFIPAAAFPAGATVKYYFHGFDNGGGHIYDSQNAQNYTLTVPGGGSGSLVWNAHTVPATIVDGTISGVDIAAYNGTLYAAWATRSNDYNAMMRMWLSKKVGAGAWQAPRLIAEIAGWQSPKIAASASGLHLVYADYQSLLYSRSENEGVSWSTPIAVSNAAYPEIRADADYAYMIFNRYGAPDNSRMFFTKLYKNDAAFSEPVFIFSNVSYKTTVYVRDFDVSGQRLHLLTYASSWYGGYVQYFFHESQNGGQSWTGGTQPGQAAHVAPHADGRVSYIAADTGPGGAGLYFQSKPYAGSWISYVNAWPGEGTCDALRRIDTNLITVSQRSGLRYYRTSSDNGISWGSPVQFDTRNGWSVKDISDASSMHILLLESGATNGYYTLSTGGGAGVPVQWIGNSYHWPPNSELDAWDDLWINTEVFPKNAATNVQVVYSSNGSNWITRDLAYSGATPANDQFHVNIGKFPAGATIKYALVAKDRNGGVKWDNNGGQDYAARVSQNQNVQAPVFWGLDPYRQDNEKIRVNGAAKNAQQDFGTFTTGQYITVVTRPVENGNGGSVQFACSIVSKLHYTTTPGNWANAITVTGRFNAAAMSNKPIFDNYSYDIGMLPPGSQVEFWIEAANSAGTTYAQSAGQDFKFRIGGASNGDSDNDGLPDAWESEWIGSLAEDANGNTDGDGPMGRPYANIIEYLTGGHPKVPNDPMGVRLLWAPAYPQAGQTVTLSYVYGNEGNPLFGKPIYGHVGFNGWQNTITTPRLQPNGAIGRFETTIQIPPNATEINVVFHNNAGIWDNNGGKDWKILVRPAGAPAPAAAPSLTSTSLTSASPTPVSEDITVTLRLTGVKSDNIVARIGRNGWKNSAFVRMTRQADGALTATYKTKAGRNDINVVFRDGRGRWYTNGGKGWTFSLAGNEDQTVTLGR